MVETLIRSARRRFFLNEALAQSALAGTILLGGFALLLVLGTGLLGIWSLAVFAAIAGGLAFYRVRRRTPDEYSTALRVDRSQNLHDALSTAVYFAHQPTKASTWRDEQLKQADEAAGRVAVASAAPFTFPPAAYALAVLALLSTGLTGLRYHSGRLDLKAPLTAIFFEDTQANAKNRASGGSKGPKWQQEAQNLLGQLNQENDPNQPLPGDPDQLQNAMNAALQEQQKSMAGAGQKGADGKDAGKEGADDDQDANADPLEGSSKDQNQSGDQSQSGSDKSGGAKEGSKAASGKNGESLMSKLKDALSTMLSKAKQDSSQQMDPNNKQQDGDSDSMDGDQVKAARAESAKNSGQAADGDNDPNTTGANSDNAQGKLDAKNGKPGQAGSGIGHQDGSKEIKQAELLKAMGKISELIGKRSNEVSGETQIEVPSGSQQLKTAYSKTQATHGETDGDVTRDEIPVSLQPYVQQYFEQVRKSADAKASPNGKTTAADASQPKK